MNPPFSNADKHILHTYEIAPRGCKIIALCNGKESLILITLDPDGKKVCMTMAELDDDGMTEVIVADDGFVTSKDEVGYETFEEDYKGMWEK